MSTQPATDTTVETNSDEAMTGHVYDGIQEYDNPTPGWWTMIFIGSVVFSACYFFTAVISSGGLSATTELAYDIQQENIKQFGALGDIEPNAATLIKFANDPKWHAVGETIFIGKCAACHAKDGSGINGPNLTDDKYVWVKKIEDIVDVIAAGRNNGAMPSWRSSLSTNEQIMVAAYVSSLRGGNKPGKAPEPNAVAIDPWPAQ